MDLNQHLQTYLDYCNKTIDLRFALVDFFKKRYDYLLDHSLNSLIIDLERELADLLRSCLKSKSYRYKIPVYDKNNNDENRNSMVLILCRDNYSFRIRRYYASNQSYIYSYYEPFNYSFVNEDGNLCEVGFVSNEIMRTIIGLSELRKDSKRIDQEKLAVFYEILKELHQWKLSYIKSVKWDIYAKRRYSRTIDLPKPIDEEPFQSFLKNNPNTDQLFISDVNFSFRFSLVFCRELAKSFKKIDRFNNWIDSNKPIRDEHDLSFDELIENLSSSNVYNYLSYLRFYRNFPVYDKILLEENELKKRVIEQGNQILQKLRKENSSYRLLKKLTSN